MSRRSVSELQAEIEDLVAELTRLDVYYELPEGVNRTPGGKFRLHGHTRGNTKNQRKQMLRLQSEQLAEAADHLAETLHRHTISSSEAEGSQVPDQSKTHPAADDGDSSSLSEEDVPEWAADLPSLFKDSTSSESGGGGGGKKAARRKAKRHPTLATREKVRPPCFRPPRCCSLCGRDCMFLHVGSVPHCAVGVCR